MSVLLEFKRLKNAKNIEEDTCRDGFYRGNCVQNKGEICNTRHGWS